MNQGKRTKVYRVLILLAVLLGILTFTPIIMPYGKHEPSFLHLPYTMWTGIIVAVLFVLLTWYSVRIHPGKEEDES
jgi:hypothetical protein